MAGSTSGRAARRRRHLVLVALTLGFSAITACQPEVPQPTAPSPGLPVAGPAGSAPAPAPVDGSPGSTIPGIRLVATVRTDGAFEVTERLFLRAPTKVVPLRLPLTTGLGPALRAADPAAADVRVSADGRPVPLRASSLRSPRELSLAKAVTRLDLTYRLTGATIRSTPSPTGRAFGVIAPLTAAADATLPTDLLVTGTALRNAVCPRLAETRCAVGAYPRLSIQPRIPASRAIAVLQLDLPTGR